MDALRLEQGGTLRIEEPAGVVVEVSRGEVWLTQEHDSRDYFLRAGDWLRIDRNGCVIVSAVGEDAGLVIHELAPGRPQSPSSSSSPRGRASPKTLSTAKEKQ